MAKGMLQQTTREICCLGWYPLGDGCQAGVRREAAVRGGGEGATVTAHTRGLRGGAALQGGRTHWGDPAQLHELVQSVRCVWHVGPRPTLACKRHYACAMALGLKWNMQLGGRRGVVWCGVAAHGMDACVPPGGRWSKQDFGISPT